MKKNLIISNLLAPLILLIVLALTINVYTICKMCFPLDMFF